MIEATCTACGTVNRIADADVPVGARFVNCASCKSRVAIPAKPAAAPKPAGQGAALDLADLPAPRRHSPLGGEAAKPAPRSGLSAASGGTELPAPRGAPKKPGSASSPGPLDLDDLLAPAPADGGADLPAPRPAGQRSVADLPAPRPKNDAASRPGLGGRAMTDLPVPGVADTAPLGDLPVPKPKAAAGLADLPAPRPKAAPKPLPKPGLSDLPGPKPKAPSALADLPAPKPAAPGPLPAPKPVKPGGADLPMPKPAGGVPDLPMPKPAGGVPDLPIPKPASGMPDLPMPKPAGGVVDLPMPKPGGVTDLPMPKAGGVTDLPMPKPGGGVVDLPTPRPGGLADLPTPKPGGTGDLPAPKGFFEDLPQPARGGGQSVGTDVAPKGFFEDLPQPARDGGGQTAETDVAPKGFFEDLPGKPTRPAGPEAPAPKGFFEDLPARPSGPARPGEVAPKGFFEDLPARPSGPAKPGEVAPKGLFEDLPGKRSGKAEVGGFFDDLPKPTPAAPGDELELDSLDLDSEPSQSGIELDLAEDQPRAKAPSVAPAPGPSSAFDDLDLSTPSPVSFAKKTPGAGPMPRPGGPGAVATITPQAAAAAAAVAAKPSFGPKGGDLALELEEPRQAGPQSATPKLAPKERPIEAKQTPAESASKRKRKRQIAGIAVVGALALGGGGFYMYQRHAKAQQHENAVNEALSSARRSIVSSQWQRAAIAANDTLALDKNNAEALGIRAEALFALGIAEGGNQGRFGQARQTINRALEASVSHPSLERAQALSPLAANQPDQAIPRLKQLAARAPNDGALQLYLGWAYAALGDNDAALQSLEAAMATPAVKVPALFARARAKQAKGDLEGARADYAAVIDVQKDNVAAQVGLASTLPAAQSQQQEADLLAILALKDVEKKQPQAATQAWILAAEVAKRGGRLDVARERFRKALALQAAHVAALTGLAEVELRDGKLDVAQELIGKALQQIPNDIRAQLVAIEIALAQQKLEDAALKLNALEKRTPPPPVVEQARMKTLSARILEAQGKEQAALDAYVEAAELAGDLDLTPALTAAAKHTELADKAAAANDVARASELRKKADALLADLSDAALADPALALTLGMAYLEANDAVKAESWLRKTIEMSPKNVDALYQLAKSLSKQGKGAEAIANLRTAVEIDPTRTEIGIELARTYEEAKRYADAEKLYDKLLVAKEPSLELRARAGRFFARIKEIEKAAEQGAKILEQQYDHPAGLYLKGEGLLAAGKTDPARKLFAQASDVDPEAQYLDARGRAAEQWARESENTSYEDEALRAYQKAVEADPSYFASWVGMGRLFVGRKEDAKAIEPLQKAWNLEEKPEVARLMGIAVMRLNAQPKVAAEWLEKSWAMEEHADTAYHLANVYTDPRVNNPKGAISAFDRATRLALAQEKATSKAPAWLTDALYALGDLRFQQTDYRGAKSAWEKWLGRNPDAKSARYREVTTHMATTLRSVP